MACISSQENGCWLDKMGAADLRLKQTMKWIARLCCCSCLYGSAKIKEKKKKKTRGDLRRELLEQQRPLMDQSLLDDMPPQYEEGESADFLEAERRDKAARPIQAIVRGFLARQRFLALWMEAIEEADKYWLYQYWLQAEEERLRRLRARARKEVRALASAPDR